jgi:hypothetical protein
MTVAVAVILSVACFGALAFAKAAGVWRERRSLNAFRGRWSRRPVDHNPDCDE